MKKEVHPKYYTDAKIICACGNTLAVGSTKQEVKTELCSACHPFYSGKQKIVDAARRVEKFNAKMVAKDEVGKDKKGKKVKREERAQVKAEKTKK